MRVRVLDLAIGGGGLQRDEDGVRAIDVVRAKQARRGAEAVLEAETRLFALA